MAEQELKSIKFQMMLSPTEAGQLDDWGFGNRIRSRAEAIRRLCQIGLAYDRDGLVLLERSTRALKATLMTLDKIGKEAVDRMPKGISGGLRVVLEEQLAANKAALSSLVAAEVYRDGKDTSEMEALIKRAEGYVETMVTKERPDDIPAFMTVKP